MKINVLNLNKEVLLVQEKATENPTEKILEDQIINEKEDSDNDDDLHEILNFDFETCTQKFTENPKTLMDQVVSKRKSVEEEIMW